MADERFVNLWTRGDGMVRIAYEEAARLEAAVREFLRSGKREDRVLALRAHHGETYYVLASEITSWMASEPASREAERQLSLALKDEEPHDWQEA